MPHPVINPPPQAKNRDKADGQQRRAHPLRQQGAQKDAADEGDKAAQLVVADALHHHLPLPQAQPPPEQQQEQGGDGHEAQAAHLDQGDNDHLSEGGPVGTRILLHQAGHAGGGGGGKQRVGKGRAAGGDAGEGQHQQPRPQKNHDKKAQGDNLHTGQLCFFPSFHRHPCHFRARRQARAARI